MKSSKAMILAVMDAILAIAKRSLKNSGLQRGLQPVTSRYRCDAIATVWPPMLDTLLFDQGLDRVCFDQTVRPTILLDATMLQCFAAYPIKLS